jgi:hypothetical protein
MKMNIVFSDKPGEHISAVHLARLMCDLQHFMIYVFLIEEDKPFPEDVFEDKYQNMNLSYSLIWPLTTTAFRAAQEFSI